MSTMTTEEIATAFADAGEHFPACVGQPDIGFCQDLRKLIATVCVEIPFDLTHGGVNNVVAIVMTASAYRDAFGRDFVVSPKVGI